jgi:DNA-binding CsgD family transcriptional regulator
MGNFNLTGREKEILGWIAEGKTNVEIAVILDISASTVKKHVEHIFEKLDVTNRTAAAMRASDAGKPGASSARLRT